MRNRCLDIFVGILIFAAIVGTFWVLLSLLPSTPQVGTAIDTQNVYVIDTTGTELVSIDTEALILTTYSVIECTLVGEAYRPEALLSIVSKGADISDFFRTDIYGVTGLKVIINDEMYWLRLWKEE